MSTCQGSLERFNNQMLVFSLCFSANATTSLAALSKLSSKKMPSSFSLGLIISLALSELVPLSLRTIGLLRPTYSAAVIIELAKLSHFKIPPKMLMKIESTSGSLFKSLMASTIYSSSALPPTSRKLAGFPP